MVRTFQAIEYLKPADRGINRPVVLRGITVDGSLETIFVKTTAGYGDRPTAAGVELFTTLLGRALGLFVPEPVIVEIPSGFERVIFDAPEYREMLGRSAGKNFGTIALGSDWKTWPVGMSVRAFPEEMIEDILTFDALVQHTDRAADNPNLLWKDHQIAVVDHEKCFGHLCLSGSDQRPWRPLFGNRPLLTHCLRLAINTKKTDSFGQRLQTELIGFEFNGKIAQLLAVTAESFPEARLDLDRIGSYFEKLHKNNTDFFDDLRMSLQS